MPPPQCTSFVSAMFSNNDVTISWLHYPLVWRNGSTMKCRQSKRGGRGTLPRELWRFFTYVENILTLIYFKCHHQTENFNKQVKRSIFQVLPVCWWRHYNDIMTSSRAPTSSMSWSPQGPPADLTKGSRRMTTGKHTFIFDRFRLP